MPPSSTARARTTRSRSTSARISNRGIAWLDNLCGRVIGRLARVGPVSLHCKVKPFVKVGVGTKTAVSAGFGTTLHVGIKDNQPTLTGDSRMLENPVQHVVEGGNSSVSAGGELGLSIGLYGSDPSDTAWLGLTLDLAAGPEFVVRGPTAAANLSFRLALTAELELDARFKDWKKTRKLTELNRKLQVWQSNSGSFQTLTTGPATKPTLENVPVHAIPDCSAGGCTAVALAENVRPGIHVALVTRPVDQAAETLYLVSFKSEREYVDSAKMLREQDYLYLPELDTGPFACDRAAHCFVTAGVGAHSEIAGAAELDTTGRFR